MSDLHEEAERVVNTSHRRRYVIQGAVSLVVACLTLATTLAVQGWSGAEGDRDENATIAQTYSDQLESEGITPAVDPGKIKGDAGPKGDTGATGATGARGPAVSAVDVARAVRSYCQGGRCKGGPGQAGPAVTQVQVADAVRAYCSANGRCRGETGAQGAAGAAGQNGTDGRQGEQGPPPTDAQISAAVEAFCSGGACQGPAGETGAPGPQGEPGPACPAGSTATTRQVLTTVAPLGEPAVLCIPDAP